MLPDGKPATNINRISQHQKQNQIRKCNIKKNSIYLWGEGKGATVAEADRNALSDLTSKIKDIFSSLVSCAILTLHFCIFRNSNALAEELPLLLSWVLEIIFCTIFYLNFIGSPGGGALWLKSSFNYKLLYSGDE